MKDFFFSFIVPIYKIHFLKKSIDSILNQSYSNFELILVNDASPDNISDLVQRYNDNRISYYVHDVNIGMKDLVKNWNDCLNYANGEFVILASDDDIYHPDYLKTINELINKYPTVDVFRSRVAKINSNNEITDFDYRYDTFLTQSDFVYFWAKGLIKCISNYAFNRVSLINNGGFVNFPCAWFSDDATVISMSQNGIVNTQEILFYFRYSNINISMKKDRNILRSKLQATDLFIEWIHSINKNCVYSNNYLNPSYYIHNNVLFVTDKILSSFNLFDFFFVLKYLINNKFMYKNEKLKIFINYLSAVLH